MPRARQRIVTCDCLDCRDDPVISTSTESTSTAANEAAARQEPPPKSLFIIASGFLQPGSGDEATSLEAALLPHLDKCAVQGSANLAACRPKECDRDASCVELKEVLGLITDTSSSTPPENLQKRFKGMQATIASNNPQHFCVAEAAGLQTSSMLSTTSSSSSLDEQPTPGISLPSAELVAKQALQELGLEEQAAGIDMLLLSVDLQQAMRDASGAAAAGDGAGQGRQQASADDAFQASVSALHWLDELVMQLNRAPLFKDTILLSILLTSQGQKLSAQPLLQPGGPAINPRAVISAAPGISMPAAPSWQQAGGITIARPVQSFETLQGQPVATDLHAPMLLVRRLPGVVRRDAAQTFCLQAYVQACRGQGALLVDRVLPEIAYKLGRALKYGA